MKATINDVSRLAKVSISTVSHVLNGTRPVNEDTRQRVLRAIEETGYIPILMAKGRPAGHRHQKRVFHRRCAHH